MTTGLALAALCSLASPAHAADELSLRGDAGEKLSGTVTGIEESGVIVLSSPLTDEPLRLKPDTVTKVRFDVDNEETKPAAMLVELANGDRLPVEVTSYSADKGMRITSPAVGELVLASVRAGLAGTRPPRTQTGIRRPGRYRRLEQPAARTDSTTSPSMARTGPSADDWKPHARSMLHKTLCCASTVQWEARQQPNIKIHFASPDVNSVTKADRYFLQFSSAGFEVKRERTKTSGFPSILISNRKPEEFAARQVDVEIHVNRATKRIDLYLNGELETWGVDPEPAAPTGGGIILGINGMNGTSHTIRNLTIHELDNTRVRHRAEDRGNPNQDSLISRDDDRWTGELREIRKQGAQIDFLFQIPQRKEPLEIPIEDISTVFLPPTLRACRPRTRKIPPATPRRRRTEREVVPHRRRKNHRDPSAARRTGTPQTSHPRHRAGNRCRKTEGGKPE